VRRYGLGTFTYRKRGAPYTRWMPRRVFYKIEDRSDGQFDAVVTIEPANVLRRDGFASLAEAEEWVEGLRFIMAAIGAPVARDDGFNAAAGTQPATTKSNS
jgi:hypothetical protein